LLAGSIMNVRQVLVVVAAALLLAAVLLPLGAVFLISMAVLLIPMVPLLVIAVVVGLFVALLRIRKPDGAPAPPPRTIVYVG
jgi:uncharacterized membrane protein (DUF106 family)